MSRSNRPENGDGRLFRGHRFRDLATIPLTCAGKSVTVTSSAEIGDAEIGDSHQFRAEISDCHQFRGRAARWLACARKSVTVTVFSPKSVTVTIFSTIFSQVLAFDDVTVARECAA
ncbi:MAG: hypothetical protein ACJ8ER_10155 [Allosphingosinicella sp.]